MTLEAQAPKCAVACDFASGELRPSYVATGTCGERLVFGVSQVLEERDVAVPRACLTFKRELLRIFGPGGPRRFDAPHMPLSSDFLHETGPDGVRRRRRGGPLPPEPNEGLGFEATRGLGRYPGSRVDDPSLADLAEEAAKLGRR